jgi:FAD/FMN-containing dehydrogenase
MSEPIQPKAIDELRREFRGDLIMPDSPSFDEARVIFNSMIDRRPGVIAQCADAEDVIRAVNFGRENGVEIAVRGGGTAWPGNPSPRVGSSSISET